LVGDYWRERRRQRAEVYVPLVHRPGEAEVDFFEVVVEVGVERRKVWEFLLRLLYCEREFAWLYERCYQLAFLEGHVRAFHTWAGWYGVASSITSSGATWRTACGLRASSER
jgi:hypothetical protein